MYIYPKHTQNIPATHPKHTQNTPKTHPKHTQTTPKTHVYGRFNREFGTSSYSLSRQRLSLFYLSLSLCIYIPKTYTKHTHKIPKAYPKHTQNTPKTHPKHTQNTLNPHPKHMYMVDLIENLARPFTLSLDSDSLSSISRSLYVYTPKTYTKYTQNIPKSYPKHTQNTPKTHPIIFLSLSTSFSLSRQRLSLFYLSLSLCIYTQNIPNPYPKYAQNTPYTHLKHTCIHTQMYTHSHTQHTFGFLSLSLDSDSLSSISRSLYVYIPKTYPTHTQNTPKTHHIHT